MQRFARNFINSDVRLTTALDLLNQVEAQTLFAMDAHRRVVGTLTDGDVRRALLQGAELGDPVHRVMHRDFTRLYAHEALHMRLRDLRASATVRLVPVLDAQGRALRVLDLRHLKSLLPIEAVVMAGGRGQRLRPLTDAVPKPMLRIGEKPIIAHTIHRLAQFGIQRIYVSIRYLGDDIEAYLGDGRDQDLDIRYVREEEPLGTIGGVSRIPGFASAHVLVMNSDLLTTIDFEALYQHALDTGADMVVASAPYRVKTPFAILEVEEGRIRALSEKPTFTYYSNAGIYLMRREMLAHIPHNQFFNATDLVERLIALGLNVVHFPIQGYWLDIGEHEDFIKAQQDIHDLNL